MSRIIFSLFLSGLLLGSGPCLVTCGPILISYIVATKQNPRQAILVWLLFSLSRICVYIFLSISIFLLGGFLVRHNLMSVARYVYLIGGGIVVLAGILMILRAQARPACIFSLSSGTLAGRFLKIQPVALGLIMGLLPCMPLLAVLSYIGLLSFNWKLCVIYSLVFGLGTLISPLVLLALGAGVIPGVLHSRPGIHLGFRIISGLIIVFFGFQLIFQSVHG